MVVKKALPILNTVPKIYHVFKYLDENRSCLEVKWCKLLAASISSKSISQSQVFIHKQGCRWKNHPNSSVL